MNTTATRNVWLASWLLSNDLPFLRAVALPGRRSHIATFVFDDPDARADSSRRRRAPAGFGAHRSARVVGRRGVRGPNQRAADPLAAAQLEPAPDGRRRGGRHGDPRVRDAHRERAVDGIVDDGLALGVVAAGFVDVPTMRCRLPRPRTRRALSALRPSGDRRDLQSMTPRA